MFTVSCPKEGVSELPGARLPPAALPGSAPAISQVFEGFFESHCAEFPVCGCSDLSLTPLLNILTAAVLAAERSAVFAVTVASAPAPAPRCRNGGDAPGSTPRVREGRGGRWGAQPVPPRGFPEPSPGRPAGWVDIQR